MKYAQALKAAKALGYTGAEKRDEVWTWLKGQNPDLTIGAKKIDFATETLEDDAAPARKALVLEDEPPAQKAELPGDWQAKVQAMVAAESAKALAAQAGTATGNDKRPGAISEISVTSMEERRYEQRIKNGQAKFCSYEGALGFGHWCKNQFGLYVGKTTMAIESAKMLDRMGVKTITVSDPTSAGPLVPEVFQADLIKNVNDYGVWSKLAKVVQMTDSEFIYPVRTGGQTAYYPAEAAAGTTSQPTYANKTLRAKTAVVNCVASQQSLDDSAINLADELADEMTRAIALERDQCLLVANAEATHGGMVGFNRKFGTAAANVGYEVLGATTADAHTLAQVLKAFSRVPTYARGNMAVTCTPQIGQIIFDRLAASTPGGLQYRDFEGLKNVPTFMGVPIIYNDVMNTDADVSGASSTPSGFTAGDNIDFFVGDFRRAALFGDRKMISIEMDRSRGFDSYTVYFRAVSRHDVNVHNAGPTGDASTTIIGPVVAFWQD